ncbi:MAG: hypothetical protein LC734_02795 [Acidobacteria bacterium]|nr:hypothetical protein [Acidobacteriota bacterium]
MRLRVFILIAAIILFSLSTGCGIFDATISSFTSAVGLTDTGVVISKTAQIRTSYAVVAADLLEVKRGERLEVIDQLEFERVRWLRVRAGDAEKTEGWVEAQHVITSEVLDKSRKLAEEFQDRQAQAAGQLRAASNLRLSSDMSTESVLFKRPLALEQR